MAATLINHSGNVKKPVSPLDLLPDLGEKYRLDGSPRLSAEEIESEKRELLRRLEG